MFAGDEGKARFDSNCIRCQSPSLLLYAASFISLAEENLTPLKLECAHESPRDLVIMQIPVAGLGRGLDSTFLISSHVLLLLLHGPHFGKLEAQ